MICSCVLPYSNPNACRTCPNNPNRAYYSEPIDYERLAEEIAKKMQPPARLTYYYPHTKNAGQTA